MIDTTYKNNTYLQDYYEEVKKGNILVCREMKMLLRKLMTEMESEEYLYNTREADLRISFIENCCRLTKAPFYGKPMKLMLWQKAFITAIFSFKMELTTGIDEETGEEIKAWCNRFNEVLMLIQRKNGKTELNSALALSDLILGDEASSISVASNDDSQSQLLYNAINAMKEQLDPKEKDLTKTIKNIKCKFNKSELFRLSEKMKNLEGRNISRGYIDEVNMMAKDSAVINSIKQSTSVQETGKDLVIYLTSEGFVEDGFLDGLTERNKKILKGELDDKRFLGWIYKNDSELEVFEALDDPQGYKVWQKANPTLGTVKKIDYIKNKLFEAQNDNTVKAWVLNKDFGIKQSSALSWLNPSYYRNDKNFNLADFKNCICVGGVDMSFTTDLTSLSLIFMKKNDRTLYVHNMNWITSEKLKNNDDAEKGAEYEQWIKDGVLRVVDDTDIDTSLITEYLVELYNLYHINYLCVGYDNKFADAFEKTAKNYFQIERVEQSSEALNDSIRKLENEFRRGNVNLQNNNLIKWCLSNCSLKLNEIGKALLVKKNKDKRNRIDAAVSLVIAVFILRKYREKFERFLN